MEIWLIADGLSQQRKTPIDFRNPEDQDLLIAHTYQKLVRYCETNVRYARRLDAYDAEGNSLNYTDRLSYGETEDPANKLITLTDTPSITIDRHSLGSSWISVLDLCNNKMTAVAYFLKISLGHSYRCFNQALHITQQQYSLPLYQADKVSLSPRPWRRYRLYRKPEQLAFVFDEELPLQ